MVLNLIDWYLHLYYKVSSVCGRGRGVGEGLNVYSCAETIPKKRWTTQ